MATPNREEYNRNTNQQFLHAAIPLNKIIVSSVYWLPAAQETAWAKTLSTPVFWSLSYRGKRKGKTTNNITVLTIRCSDATCYLPWSFGCFSRLFWLLLAPLLSPLLPSCSCREADVVATGISVCLATVPAAGEVVQEGPLSWCSFSVTEFLLPSPISNWLTPSTFFDSRLYISNISYTKNHAPFLWPQLPPVLCNTP